MANSQVNIHLPPFSRVATPKDASFSPFCFLRVGTLMVSKCLITFPRVITLGFSVCAIFCPRVGTLSYSQGLNTTSRVTTLLSSTRLCKRQLFIGRI